MPHAIRGSKPPQPRPRSRRLGERPVLVGAVSATLGFACGALFWHAIGFWSFVSDVVLKGPDESIERDTREAQILRAEAPQQPAALRTTGSISPTRIAVAGRPGGAKAHLTCSLVVTGANSDEARVLPCPPGTPGTPTRARARKGDLEVAAAIEPAISGPEPLPLPGQRELPWQSPLMRGSLR